MNTVKIILSESGRIAELKKDFPLYQGSYQNKLINILVPTSIIAPNILAQYIGTDGKVQTESGAYTALKIGMYQVLRNGKEYKSKSYYLRYLKNVQVNGIEYALYERMLPKEFTAFAGQDGSSPLLIINVVNILNTPNDIGQITSTVTSVITSQACNLEVMPSANFGDEEVIEPSELELLNGKIDENTQLIGELSENKADKEELVSLKAEIDTVKITADEALEKVNKVDTSQYYTKTDVDEKLGKKANVGALEAETRARESADTEIKASIESVSNSIPKNTSQLTNDSGFVTNAVADLVNYYTKTQVDAKLSQIPKFAIAPVDELPTENISTTTVYLVKDMQDTGNLYTEYIYVDGAWEKLGSQTVDLTGYATETWVNAQIADFITAEQLNALAQKVDTHIANKSNPHGVTAAQIGAERAFEKKSAFNKDFGTTEGTVCQGNDSRLSDARPANGGNSATVGGKSPSDFATSGQGRKADTAYQKPSTGIPESDLSPEVQTKLNETYTLPIASATTLGGVQPATKTTEMTQDVGVDETGKLWTAPSGGGGTTVIANPAGAGTADLTKLQVGDTIYNVPSGGGGSAPVLLWEGSWDGASELTVPNIGNYAHIFVKAQGRGFKYLNLFRTGVDGWGFLGIDNTPTSISGSGIDANNCANVLFDISRDNDTIVMAYSFSNTIGTDKTIVNSTFEAGAILGANEENVQITAIYGVTPIPA